MHKGKGVLRGAEVSGVIDRSEGQKRLVAYLVTGKVTHDVVDVDSNLLWVFELARKWCWLEADLTNLKVSCRYQNVGTTQDPWRTRKRTTQ